LLQTRHQMRSATISGARRPVSAYGTWQPYGMTASSQKRTRAGLKARSRDNVSFLIRTGRCKIRCLGRCWPQADL